MGQDPITSGEAEAQGEGSAFPVADGQPGGHATLSQQGKKKDTTISVCNQFLFSFICDDAQTKLNSAFSNTVLNIYPECFPF